MIAAIFFYIFAAILLLSAAMVVTSRNPVHSVLFLILAFFNAAALFVIAGAEFLAMILVIVYVGAVAVLFLFVVMMLDVDFAELREGFQRYAPIGATIGVVLLVELGLVLTGWKVAPAASTLRLSANPAGVSNTMALGRLIYTDYVLLFQTAGLVLLVSMIGAIVLTLRDRKTSRHQNIATQVARQKADTLVMVSAGLGLGIRELGVYRPKVAELARPAHAPEHAAPAHDAVPHAAITDDAPPQTAPDGHRGTREHG
jgi:NADH-quinone oxidoreductase subunit J